MTAPEPYWLDVAAERIGLEHPVSVVHDETIWSDRDAEYRGLIRRDDDTVHLIALAPQVEGWQQVKTLCHELIHARQHELLGTERFHRETTAERAQYGNDLEGVHERQAWELGAELAVQFYPPGFKVVQLPFIVRAATA